jgi:Ca-activated chloride channel family protein
MELFGSITLRQPWWLLLALQPLLFWGLSVLRRRWQPDAFADTQLLPWVLSRHRLRGTRQVWRHVLLWLAWFGFALAMAGPRSIDRMLDPGQRHYLQLQVVVDTSYSMSARDIVPSRMQRVRLELHDLIDRMQGLRMGLIVYSARPHVMLPPTADKAVLRHAVELLRVRELPSEGSGLISALRMAQQQFTPVAASSHAPPRAILLISDGELREDVAAVRRQLREMGGSLRQSRIRLFVLGVGTPAGAALLDAEHGWLQYDGRAVISRLHDDRLQSLAQQANGAYAEIADDEAEWRTLYDDGIAQLTRQSGENQAGPLIIWRDLSAWFVLPAVVLLLLAYLRLPTWRNTAALWWLPLLLIIAGTHSPPVQAQPADYATVYSLYKAGEYRQAARGFARLPGYAARMGEAASRYQLQQYPQAAAAYIQAVLDAGNDTDRADALFNLGNCYFKQQDYAQAVQTYNDALRYRTDFPAARTNLTYAKSLLQSAQQSEAGATNRAGNGAGMARPNEGTDLSRGRASIDSSPSKNEAPTPADVDTTPQATAGNGLLEQAKPATQKIERNADVQWTYEITQAKDIQREDTHFVVDESLIWQRLFEAEEGMPAPRERPEVLPGVPPW